MNVKAASKLQKVNVVSSSNSSTVVVCVFEPHTHVVRKIIEKFVFGDTIHMLTVRPYLCGWTFYACVWWVALRAINIAATEIFPPYKRNDAFHVFVCICFFWPNLKTGDKLSFRVKIRKSHVCGIMFFLFVRVLSLAVSCVLRAPCEQCRWVQMHNTTNMAFQFAFTFRQ